MSQQDKILKKLSEIQDMIYAWGDKSYKKVPFVDRWSTDAKLLMTGLAIIPPFILTIFG